MAGKRATAESLAPAPKRRGRAVRDGSQDAKPSTLREEADELYKMGGFTRGAAMDAAREMRDQALADKAKRPSGLDVDTPLPPASNATASEAVKQDDLRTSGTTQAATATTPQEGDTAGASSSLELPGARPDLNQFLGAGAGSQDLPPAVQLVISEPMTRGELERVPTPTPASFPNVEEALSSCEGDGEDEDAEDEEIDEAEAADIVMGAKASGTEDDDLAAAADLSAMGRHVSDGGPPPKRPRQTVTKVTAALHAAEESPRKLDVSTSLCSEAAQHADLHPRVGGECAMFCPSDHGLVCPGIISTCMTLYPYASTSSDEARAEAEGEDFVRRIVGAEVDTTPLLPIAVHDDRQDQDRR